VIPLAEQRLYEFSEVFPGKIPLCPRSGRALVARGELGVVRILGRVFVPEQELERFLRERFTPAKVPIQPMKVVTSDQIIAKARLGRPRIVKEVR
jgi:hypothetical protein